MSADFHTKLIEQIVTTVSQYMRLQMKAMFICADEIVSSMPVSYGISEKACEEALRSLQLSKANIVSNYTYLISQQLKPQSIYDVEVSSSKVLNEFVKQDEVDVMVAMTAIYSKALSESEKSVQQLETRLEYLEISTIDSFEKQAVSPKQLCETFYKALASSGVNNSHSLVLLLLYDQTINANLSEMYEELNSILIEANVLPNIIMDSHAEDGVRRDDLQPRSVNYYDPMANKAEHYIERTENDTNYFAMNYMNGDMSVSPDAIDLPESFKKVPSFDEINGKNCYARKDIVVALSKLQQALTSEEVGVVDCNATQHSVDIGVIKSSLLNSMNVKGVSTENGKHVNVLDERSIDFVGMMFDVIADDSVIPSLIKAQLMRLQISVIKVSITDKTLFEDDNHPVRNVLNLITKVGQGIVSDEDEDYKKLSAIISKLLKDYYLDIISFKRAEKELKALYSCKEALLKKNEYEARRKIIKEHARNVVLTELKCLSAKKIIPEMVQPLVLKYLPTIMINQYVLHGRDSAQWKESSSLLKRLIQCMQPLRKNDDWLYLKENETSLVHDLTIALHKTTQDKKPINDLLDNIKEQIKDMILDFGFKNIEDNGHSEQLSDIVNDMVILESPSSITIQSDEDSALVNSDDSNTDELETALQDALSLAQQKIDDLPEQVHPGVWFEIYNGEEHAVRRLKLSVILNETAKIVFSDRRGNTVMEKDAADFADELATDKSKVIADHSTFDHALGRVISSLAA